MNENNSFNEEEIKKVFNKMEFQRMEDLQLTKEDIISIVENSEEVSNNKEIYIDLDKMRIHRIEGPRLTEEEILYIIENYEELSKNKAVEFDLDCFIEPSPADIVSYYSFWRIKLFDLINTSELNRIIENDFDEKEIFNILGITKDELLKPNSIVYYKAKEHILKTKDELTK